MMVAKTDWLEDAPADWTSSPMEESSLKDDITHLLTMVRLLERPAAVTDKAELDQIAAAVHYNIGEFWKKWRTR